MARVTRVAETFDEMGLVAWRVKDANGIWTVVHTLGAAPEGWAEVQEFDGRFGA
jgi:hypothetical protein